MRGRLMTIDAIGSPEQKADAPHTCARTIDASKYIFASLAPNRGQMPPYSRKPTRAAALPPHSSHSASGCSGACDVRSGRARVQRDSKRKSAQLSIRKLDGTNLYKGFGSGFCDWGRTFLCAGNLSKASCAFSWEKDVKANILGHFLVGTTERHYHKQLDAWWFQ